TKVSFFATMIFTSILLETAILAVSHPITHASVCSLEDLKVRLRDSCSELRVPTHFGEFERTRRSYSDISPDASKPNYYVRVKRDQVQVICCTPKLIPTYGHRCIDFYSC
ncbi:hypothetical protein HUJ05_002615, partial [Dendroctonus ponderosae]